ncbi:MAG: hypothetical protein ACOYN6_13575 [Ignavibacteria bacterium]
MRQLFILFLTIDAAFTIVRAKRIITMLISAIIIFAPMNTSIIEFHL